MRDRNFTATSSYTAFPCADAATLAERFDIEPEGDCVPRYNITPTQYVKSSASTPKDPQGSDCGRREGKSMWKFLSYITNNEVQSRHEEVFDAIFWVVETIALVLGIWILLAKHGAEWIAFLVIEYCWAMDNLRHNRP